MTTTAAQPEVTVYAAERGSGPDSVVERIAPLTDAEAIARLQGGEDIVVCHGDRRANRNKARELLESAFGGHEEDPPHAGRMALPHYHPPGRTPEVHAFFEAPPRIARRKRT